MRTLPVGDKNIKAFYAILFDDHGILSKLGGQIYFFGDDGTIIEYEPDMCNFCTVLGEVGLSETQALIDRIHGGASWICTHRTAGAQ
jgi:hypothetical protein